ncbi:MAG: hypothetical protein IT373_29965 [Polyangiaceae bacterium]|nr:hypothetical protein [Polyangiaceae bacterium]
MRRAGAAHAGRPRSAARTLALGALATLAATLAPAIARAGEPAPGRLADAPLLDASALPPVPPEYLAHEVAGLHFHYHPSAQGRVRPLLEEAEALRAELSAALGASVLDAVEVRIAVSTTDLERILPPGAPVHSVALARQRALVLGLGTPNELDAAEARAAFRHGLAHLALDELGTPDTDGTTASRLPAWFQEGWALAFSQQAEGARGRTIWWAMMQRRLVPIAELERELLLSKLAPSSVPVAEAADFARYLVEERARDGGSALPALVTAVRAGASFDDALEATYGRDADALEQSWRRELARHRAFLPVLGFVLCAWGLWAGARALWRWRRARPSAAVRPPSRRRVSARAAARAAELARAGTRRPAVPVPKVAHQGQWHTLH